MGYTHYWTPVRSLLPELPTAFVIHVREVLALARTRVRLVDDRVLDALHDADRVIDARDARERRGMS